MASGGYPASYKTGNLIKGVDELKHRRDVFVFHAGTQWGEERRLVTAGGRVLAVSALGENLKEARARAYEAVDSIYFRDMHFRKDIGMRALGRKEALL